jgi:hypothetical protein
MRCRPRDTRALIRIIEPALEVLGVQRGYESPRGLAATG